MNLIGRGPALLHAVLLLAFRTGAPTFVLGVVPRVAFAQVQDDAALADVPDEKTPPVQGGTPSFTTPSATGFDDPAEKTKEQQEAELAPPLTTAELRAAH